LLYFSLQEAEMAHIRIKDLPQSTELDRTAMRAITGGARARGRMSGLEGTSQRNARIVDYPPGFARDTLTPADQRGTK
jgi:hypothetical protein